MLENKGNLMIKNIVLDMGNVLLDYNPEFVLTTFCSSPEEKDIIDRELFNGPEWKMGDKGDLIKTIWGMGYKFET